MIASVLGVGTELTSGQILNRNGWWISRQLKGMGLTTSVQLVVPDDRPLILQALDFCFDRSELIFVTGGLGPTSDDFTRDLICEFAGCKTFFDQKSWQKIVDRFASRGLTVNDFQRQQCYFPEGSVILENSNGTANAFHLKHSGKHFFVLPGPPSEIEVVWNEHLGAIIKELTHAVDKSITHSWDILGRGESEVAALLEPIVAGGQMDVAYRVQVPFVEFKLTHLESQYPQVQSTLKKVDQALEPYHVSKGGTDAAQILCQKMESVSSSSVPYFCLVDEVSGGYLLSRLMPYAKNLLKQNKLQFISQEYSAKLEPDSIILRLSPSGANRALAQIGIGSQMRQDYFTSPYLSAILQEREGQYFAEKALLLWAQELEAKGPSKETRL